MRWSEVSVGGADGLVARSVDFAYHCTNHAVLQQVSARIRPGAMTVIVGPNGCGKSTFLRTLGRILSPERGAVTLNGQDVRSIGSGEFARRVGFLAQSTTVPDDVTVADLVGRGRYPHQSLLRQWSTTDQIAVADAMQRTDVAELAERRVGDLSGGQRQRVWIAMVLAQQTETLLLDEPTTFLDMRHQVEVLELCRDLTQSGLTVLAVLHDLAQAARYGDEVIVMSRGRVVAQGEPEAVITADLVQHVFGVPVQIVPCPQTGTPLVVPLASGLCRQVVGTR